MDVLCAPPDVVDHDGRLYLLVDLLFYLPQAFLCQISQMVPRTAQAFWDEVVHRWPYSAEEAAGAVDRDWNW